jgi:hypothetical protein
VRTNVSINCATYNCRKDVISKPRKLVNSNDRQESHMRDPLNNFEWSSLYRSYDNRCSAFDRTSVFLSAPELDRSESDRALYYQLVNLLSEERRNSITQPIGIYEALLYWKLYSQSTALYNLDKWLRQDVSKRKSAQEKLLQLFQELPTSIEKNPSVIVERIKWLGKFQLPGIASPSTLPVRTTFLHFLYPSIVPIFDQMVLKAVGAWDKNANHKTSVLKNYLPFAWELAEKHAQQISNFTKEGPMRVIDMALWVSRGNE